VTGSGNFARANGVGPTKDGGAVTSGRLVVSGQALLWQNADFETPEPGGVAVILEGDRTVLHGLIGQ